MTPILLTDFYKVEHYRMYPERTTMIYSNFTPRKSRMAGVNEVVVFGLQAFIKKYLIDKFNKDFFDRPLEEVLEEYRYAINTSTEHIEELYKLGYLPIEIKALPEGSRCPIGIPLLTIRNTKEKFGWLTNYLETLISCELWQPITSATIADRYRHLLDKYALETTGSTDFVQWQGHDFSMRGMSSVDSAINSGMGHLLSFTGTDTIPAIYALRRYYGSKALIGASVPATEHSVMCMGTKEGELETLKRLLTMYPTGILSVVYDTWDLFGGIKKIGEDQETKDLILSRDGKLVIRPDSGDPADIICGTNSFYSAGGTGQVKTILEDTPQGKGVVELLWEIFGGTINEYGYKELNSHIGVIYGDSITLERAEAICERLKAKGFASTNIVFGIGSYTYQYNTRDTFGFAMKATYGEVDVELEVEEDAGSFVAGDKILVKESREIFKSPATDSGEKKSAKGLLQVYNTSTGYKLKQQCTWEEEKRGDLSTVFINSQLIREYTLDEIRERLKN